MNEKKLLQIKISNPCFEELNQMKQETGFNISEIIKYAIALFKWVVEKRKNGFEIYAIPNPERKEGEIKGSAEKVNLLLPM